MDGFWVQLYCGICVTKPLYQVHHWCLRLPRTGSNFAAISNFSSILWYVQVKDTPSAIVMSSSESWSKSRKVQLRHRSLQSVQQTEQYFRLHNGPGHTTRALSSTSPHTMQECLKPRAPRTASRKRERWRRCSHHAGYLRSPMRPSIKPFKIFFFTSNK